MVKRTVSSQLLLRVVTLAGDASTHTEPLLDQVFCEVIIGVICCPWVVLW